MREWISLWLEEYLFDSSVTCLELVRAFESPQHHVDGQISYTFYLLQSHSSPGR